MANTCDPERRQRLRELLLTLLCDAGCPAWPGADGTTTDDVLQAFPREAKAGRVPGLQQLLAEHPDLREELAALFDGQDG
jgi:hypothetical protein